MNNPKIRAWLSLVLLAIAMGLLLFVPAGTAQYWQAWVYLGVYFGCSAFILLYLTEKDPALLKRRMSGGPTAEKETTQKVIMLFTSLGFIALIGVPALDHRMQWSQVSPLGTLLGNFLVAVWWFMAFIAFRENTFASATVEVAGGQKVISTGPYAAVRHPMYAGGLLLIFGTPLALGSYWGLIVPVAMMPFLLWRLLDEERLLAKNLPGYKEYCARVRWRLLPGVF